MNVNEITAFFPKIKKYKMCQKGQNYLDNKEKNSKDTD